MYRSLQATRLIAARASRQHVQTAVARSLSTTAVRQADPVQDVYLRHIKEYKAPAEKPGDAEQHVQKFVPPSGFKSPEETNLANELSEFQNQKVETAGQEAEPSATESLESNQDWFEEVEDFEAQEHAAEGSH